MKDLSRWQGILEAAEAALASVAPDIWDRKSLPVPIRRIAEAHYGLLVSEVPSLGDALDMPEPHGQLSGVILFKQREIWIDAAEARQWPRRARFTVAHECGHWALHRTAFGQARCGSEMLRAFRPGSPSLHLTLDTIEDEANLFGGALLMPPRLLAHEHDRLGGDGAALCELFDVSPSAFGGGPGGRAHLHLSFADGTLRAESLRS